MPLPCVIAQVLAAIAGAALAGIAYRYLGGEKPQRVSGYRQVKSPQEAPLKPRVNQWLGGSRCPLVADRPKRNVQNVDPGEAGSTTQRIE